MTKPARVTAFQCSDGSLHLTEPSFKRAQLKLDFDEFYEGKELTSDSPEGLLAWLEEHREDIVNLLK